MHSQEVWVKDLIELLNNLGFSESYWEVQWYEYSVMADQSDQQDPDGFLQYVFDNVDFNIPIIDGHGTFHSMRGIQCSTPTSNSGSVGATKRVFTPRKASVIGCYAEVPIKPYTQPPSKALSKLTIKDPKEHEVATTVVERLDVLLISGHTIQATSHPSWAWFMQSAMQNTGTYDVSEIRTLPFINIPPTVVPYTLHYAMQGQSVTRLVRRPALSHLISHFISKPRKSWGQALNWPVWLFVLGLPSADVLDGCNRIYHVRKWTSRALGVRTCQEFSGTNDIRTCIQPCTASSFLDTAGFSIHSLQVLWCPGWDWSCTALQALWGCPAWGALYSWCCGGPSHGFSGSTYERHAW